MPPSGPALQAEGVTPADNALPAWEAGELPAPPTLGANSWVALLGPGLLLAGSAIGAGEWLFGPAVSAQYGAVLLWLASLSIIGQVFCNLQVMRYTLYCGEPIVVGYFRTWPGPRFWTGVYLILEIAQIWPMNAANGAVPMAAAFLGHLPSDAIVTVLGVSMSEHTLIRILGYLIFVASFIPLIFGGSVYRMLEKAMAVKLVFVLGYLVVTCLLFVSMRHAGEVMSGFLKFGTVPLRADTIVAGRYFRVSERREGHLYSLRGSLEGEQLQVVGFTDEKDGKRSDYRSEAATPVELRRLRAELNQRATTLMRENRVLVETPAAQGLLTLRGIQNADGNWILESAALKQGEKVQQYDKKSDLPANLALLARQYFENKGQLNVNLVNYLWENGRLPPLDWAMLAAFAAIAGSGGLTNTLFSNYARDKGWGMGQRVGAIPSAVGGAGISLSHVGQIFPINDRNRTYWRGWIRWIVRDQVAVWMFCSVVGMALPCMLSLEFIRNAPVAGDRVSAMLAEGISNRNPELRSLWWFMTLFTGFIVIAPGQIIGGDQIARRWTDILWTLNRRTHTWGKNQVKYIYYGILAAFFVWGMIALTLFDPLQIAKITGILGNIALGFTALHALYVNRTLLPPELRPGFISQLGTIFCGVFFFLISGIVFWHL
ncbi:MAG: Nramp family divalent metal transporter [Planctomycetales bacterium]